jgi:hypothetical protein
MTWIIQTAHDPHGPSPKPDGMPAHVLSTCGVGVQLLGGLRIPMMGHSSVAEHQLDKLATGVRFSLPQPGASMSVMSGQTKVQREALQAKTRELYERGMGCRAVADALDEHPVSTYRRLQRMGILRGRDEAYEEQHRIEFPSLPFQRAPAQTHLRSAAIGIAVRWFLDRGYIPSVPLEPARYDLVVDSDGGLQRIQIKTTNFRDKQGVWVVHAHRTRYHADAETRGVAGKRKAVPYTPVEIDFFFVVTGDLTTYLIPIAASGDRKNLTLGKKYAKFKL